MRSGFTLIELLVVVTIIVVLLALLTPALDKAIEQAEMATCGARLKGLSSAAVTYAAANKRAYPYRSVIKQNTGQPSRMITSWPAGFFDDRAMLNDYMGADSLMCPLLPYFDIQTPKGGNSDNMFSSYSVWFGFTYTSVPGSKSMDRLGQKFAVQPKFDGGDVYEFSLIASDLDHVRRPSLTWSSHPDDTGIMTKVLALGTPYYVLSGAGQQYSGWWQSDAGKHRGGVNLNYTYEDGSVLRLESVAWEEWQEHDRMVRVPEHSGVTVGENPDWHQLPRQ